MEKELKDFMSRILTEGTSSRHVLIFVDALDECDTDPARSLLSYFKSLMKSIEWKAGNLKICFSSRHYPNLGLDTIPRIVVEKQNAEDTRFIIHDLLKEIEPEIKRQELEEMIFAKSQGGLLWAVLVCRMVIEKYNYGIEMQTLSRKVALIPEALDQLSSDILSAHQNQLLYIVTFKSNRADVFYIQEDTGLEVKPGNLVIVEADRGTDLGTIQHAKVSSHEARKLKQQYTEEHHKLLMMVSRQSQNGASNDGKSTGSVASLNSRSAIGGMSPHGLHSVQESAADIKPKLINRLAQNHEILTLRDKEGNDEKARRVCQQMVAEHGLNMEILDAEFQL
jgi:hypothetical protein